MKKIFIILVFLFFGCNPLKDVTKVNLEEEFEVNESFYERITRPGDQIVILPAPKEPIHRDTTIIYKGTNGATATRVYDSEGRVASETILCPQTEEERLAELQAKYKMEMSFKEAEIDLEKVKILSKYGFYSVCALGFFGAIAFIGKAFVTRS
tara:strand:- start:52614 stop:53072 length:459 start_codon:yes stop_codon:yes gene_type:complete